MSEANLRRQLEIVTGLFGYRYGSDALHAWVLDRLPKLLAGNGLQDIRDLSTAESTFVCKSPECATDGVVDQSSGFDGVRRRRNLAGPYDRISQPAAAQCQTTSIVSRHWFNTRTGKFLREYPPVRIGKDGFAISGWMAGLFTNARACEFRSTCPRNAIKCIGDRGGVNYVSGAGFNVLEDSVLFPSIGDFSEPAESSSDRKTISVYVKFTDDGVPYFLVSKRPRSSSTDTFKQFLTLTVVAASFAIPGLGPTLASATMGSFAAAYPAIANAIVQVTLQTALNGGDVEGAVERVAASYLGGQVGNFVEGVSDSAAVARLSSVATSAAVRGESIQDAVEGAALSLAPAVVSDVSSLVTDIASQPDVSAINLPEGETAVSIFDIPMTAPNVYDDYDFDLSDIEAMGEGIELSPDVTHMGNALNVPEFAPTLDTGEAFDLDAFFDSPFADSDVTIQTGVPINPPAAIADAAPIEAPASSFFEDVTFESVVDGVTDLAIAAIRVHQAYQAANRPPVQPVRQTTRAGTVQTARPDGTLTTTDPATGRPVVTRPPAGVPYELAGGGVVMNNGNGTYTLVSPDGTSTTRPYTPTVPQVGMAIVQPAQWIEGVPNAYVLGGAGLLALALLTMGRR
jgi:hypothetical protein